MNFGRVETAIAVFALAFSIVSFAISWVQARRAARLAIRPMLVFVYEDTGWALTNLGNGPALHVVALCRDRRRSGEDGGWHRPVLLPPLAKGATYTLGWLGHLNLDQLGTVYTDAEGVPYTGICEDDHTTSLSGALIDFDRAETKRYWQVPCPWADATAPPVVAPGLPDRPPAMAGVADPPDHGDGDAD